MVRLSLSCTGWVLTPLCPMTDLRGPCTRGKGPFHQPPSSSVGSVVARSGESSVSRRLTYACPRAVPCTYLWCCLNAGAWHLFHLLLLEYVIHILESCVEEEEEEEDLGSLQDLLSDDQFFTQPDQALFHPLDSLPALECASRSVASPQVTLKHMNQSCGPTGVSGMVLQVLGFLVDTATGNKVNTHAHTYRDRQTYQKRQTNRHTQRDK